MLKLWQYDASLKTLPWQVEASIEMPAGLKEGSWVRSQSQKPSTTLQWLIHYLRKKNLFQHTAVMNEEPAEALTQRA